MTTLTDVLHTIATDVLHNNDNIRYDFNMSLTHDVPATEKEFNGTYGEGKTYSFILENEDHGRQLAIALYRYVTGKEIDLPEAKKNTDGMNPLYLFVHLRPVTAQ